MAEAELEKLRELMERNNLMLSGIHETLRAMAARKTSSCEAGCLPGCMPGGVNAHVAAAPSTAKD